MILSDRDPGTGERLDYPDDLWICREHGNTVVCPSQGRYCERCERQAALEDADDYRNRIDEALQGAIAHAKEAGERLEGYGLLLVQEHFRKWADDAAQLLADLPKVPEESATRTTPEQVSAFVLGLFDSTIDPDEEPKP